MSGDAGTGLGPSEEVVAALLDATGERVSATLLFGSRLVGASPDPHSAHDLVVLVDEYLGFYRELAEGGHHGSSPRLLAVLARILPPNVVAFFPSGPEGPVAKCMVLTVEDFGAALAPGARDHFVKGRMVQRVAVLHARDEAVGTRIAAALAAARRDVLRWAGPFLEEPFGADDLARGMLEVSYGGEIRPEAGDRVEEVFEAQRDGLVPTFREVLEKAEGEGVVERAGEGWRLTPPATALDRLRLRTYFLRSKVRATLRWFKHVVTFDDWLTYIQRKVQRRTGMTVALTAKERKYPLVFLWPKVLRVLAARPETSDEVGGARPEESDEDGGARPEGPDEGRVARPEAPDEDGGARPVGPDEGRNARTEPLDEGEGRRPEPGPGPGSAAGSSEPSGERRPGGRG